MAYKHNLLHVVTTQNDPFLKRSSEFRLGLGLLAWELDAEPVFFYCYDLFWNLGSSSAFFPNEFQCVSRSQSSMY